MAFKSVRGDLVDSLRGLILEAILPRLFMIFKFVLEKIIPISGFFMDMLETEHLAYSSFSKS